MGDIRLRFIPGRRLMGRASAGSRLRWADLPARFRRRRPHRGHRAEVGTAAARVAEEAAVGAAAGESQDVHNDYVFDGYGICPCANERNECGHGSLTALME